MTTLSLAMIVKNEAANLPRCLASVKDLVDEMVVVDTGSTDDTVAIATSFGARVGYFDWIDDFAAARNESLRLCRGDWVLVLDGDEAVDVLDHPKIRSACTKGKTPAYSLILRSYFLDASTLFLDQAVQTNDGRYSQGAEFNHYADFFNLRLCRRFQDLAFEGSIHELLNPYFQKRNIIPGTLDAVIHHFGKVDLAREEEKKNRYLLMARDEAEKHPGNHQCHYNLLIQAAVAQNWDLAIKAGESYLRLVRRPPLSGFTTLAIAYQGAGRLADSIQVFDRVLSIQPKHALALCRMALSYAALGQAEKALEVVSRALSHHPGLSTAYQTLFEIRRSQGQFSEARDALKRGIEACPKDPALREKQVRFDLNLGMNSQAVADAWEALRLIPNCGGGHWHVLVSESLLSMGHRKEGGLVLDLGLKAFPGHPDLVRLKDQALGA